MRVVACILVIITLIVGAFGIYAYNGMQMSIVGIGVSQTPAGDVQGTFDDIAAKLSQGAFYGTKYADMDSASMEDYTFLTLTVRMKNGGILPMEWVRIEVTPNAGDIAQLPEDRTPTLANGSTADFGATILTRAGADTAHKVTVSYYVLGKKMTATYDMATGK